MEVFVLIAWLSNGEPFPANVYVESNECWEAAARFDEDPTLQHIPTFECRTATLATPIAPVAPTSDMRPRPNPLR